ncbi:MAG: hypothetical protein B6D41_11805 [Chloroflexi bacterium UTCFX4]|nr:MAG: hypothetical protein B6D41_11805 [Chloroflexi bacterium UTCFX4]
MGTRQLENNSLMWQQNERATLPYLPHPPKFEADTNPIGIELVVDNPDVHCDLTAQFLNGRTLVTGAFSPDDWAEIETTCMRLFDELMQHELIDTLTSSQRGRRQIKMLSSTLIDAGKYQELIEYLADSETDNVTLPRECLVKIFTNPSLRVPVEILEKVTRDDSLFVNWNRRELIQIVRGESVSSAPAPTEQPTWRGNGEPPKTRAEKIKAIQAWDAIPRDERPPLADWLIENFGTDYATGEMLVPLSTFRGWRNLID